jgi:hypothetical protein
VSDAENATGTKGRDARWPFFMLYAVMWGSMIATSLNTDAIKMDYSLAVVLGLACILGVVVYLATARLRRRTVIAFDHSTILGNLAWHIFLLTCVIFTTFLFFTAVVQIMVLTFGAPVFENGCDRVSQRDVALFVWDAMAKGAFKFLASYLHIPAESCAPDAAGWTATITSQCIRWFTALVVVWYVVSFAKAWYIRVRQGRQASLRAVQQAGPGIPDA